MVHGVKEMRLARCPLCDRIIDLDEIEELDADDTVIGCGLKEGDLILCEDCALRDDPAECKSLRAQKGLTKTSVKDIKKFGS